MPTAGWCAGIRPRRDAGALPIRQDAALFGATLSAGGPASRLRAGRQGLVPAAAGSRSAAVLDARDGAVNASDLKIAPGDGRSCWPDLPPENQAPRLHLGCKRPDPPILRVGVRQRTPMTLDRDSIKNGLVQKS